MHCKLLKKIAIANMLLLSTASIAEPASKMANTGVSVSMKLSMTNAQFRFSDFTFDPAFNLTTKGFVGRNGKVGNVSAASISGINILPTGKGTLTLTKTIKNEVDATHIASTNKKLGFIEKTLSFGTSSPVAFPQLHQYKGLHGTSGLWMHYSGDCITCPVVVTSGMFIDGAPSAANKDIRSLESTKGIEITPSFKGVLDGMPPGDCGDGECEWGLKATLTAEPDIHKGIRFNTSQSFIHYKSNGVTRITPRPDLNLSGTLVFDSKRNLFKGKIKDGRGISGEAMGRYYGPEHNEIGIVYYLGSPSEAGTEMGSIYAVRFGGTD